MSLRTVPVSMCLDKRLTLLGFEVPDILAIFLLLSVLNFVFGETHMKLLLIWLPTSSLMLVLHFGKNGKPDNHLVHWLRFQLKPGTLSAFREPENQTAPPRLDGGKP